MLKGCQHDSNERDWWLQFGIDPLAVAKQLWGKTRLQMERTIVLHQPWSADAKAKVAAILKGKK